MWWLEEWLRAVAPCEIVPGIWLHTVRAVRGIDGTVFVIEGLHLVSYWFR